MIAALVSLAACQPPQPEENQQQSAPQPVPELPIVPRSESLDRAAILAAVAQAASANAAGADDKAAQRALDGRQFEFRIRFGCRGPSTNLRDQWLGWSFDSENNTLRVRARPTLAAEEPLVQALGGAGFEAVEGFWIPRPWLLQPVCPANSAIESATAEATGEAEKSPAQPEPITEPLPGSPRLGLAQFFSDTDPRTGRRSMRPYEAVKTLEASRPIGSQGFDLVLSGRLKALPDKRVIACVAKGAQSAPECIVSADFDRVRIETPDAEDVIAEWTSG
ncbi:MAG: hypothetical protein H0V46_04050 [Sphingomonas sp.]|nr:hypothetical protein [Sphingomonas sp.]